MFRVTDCPDTVQRAIDTYPEQIRDALTFDRALAMPEDALQPQAIYLHPGEAVFDAVATLFQGHYDHAGERGGLFFDESVDAPYLFYLAKVPIIREPATD